MQYCEDEYGAMNMTAESSRRTATEDEEDEEHSSFVRKEKSTCSFWVSSAVDVARAVGRTARNLLLQHGSLPNDDSLLDRWLRRTLWVTETSSSTAPPLLITWHSPSEPKEATVSVATPSPPAVLSSSFSRRFREEESDELGDVRMAGSLGTPELKRQRREKSGVVWQNRPWGMGSADRHSPSPPPLKIHVSEAIWKRARSVAQAAVATALSSWQPSSSSSSARSSDSQVPRGSSDETPAWNKRARETACSM